MNPRQVYAGSSAARPQPDTVHLFVDSNATFHGAVAARAVLPQPRPASTGGTHRGPSSTNTPQPAQENSATDAAAASAAAMHPPHWRTCLNVPREPGTAAPRPAPGSPVDSHAVELAGVARAVREYLRTHAAEELRGATLVVHNDNEDAVRQVNAIMQPPDALVQLRGGAALGAADATVYLDTRALKKHRNRLHALSQNVRGHAKLMIQRGEEACTHHSAAAEVAAAVVERMKQSRGERRRVEAAAAAAWEAATHVVERAPGAGPAPLSPAMHGELVGKLDAAAAALREAAATADAAARQLIELSETASAAHRSAEKARPPAMIIASAARHARDLQRAATAGIAPTWQERERAVEGGRGQGGRQPEAADAEVEEAWLEVRQAGVNVMCEWLPRKAGLMPAADKLTRPWDGDDWCVQRGALEEGVRAALQRPGRMHTSSQGGAAARMRSRLHALAGSLMASARGSAAATEGVGTGESGEPAPVMVGQQEQRDWGVPEVVWPPDIDLFASPGTSHAPMYFSAVWDGACGAVDAMTHDWSKWPQGHSLAATGAQGPHRAPVCYAFPPPSLLADVLSKVAEDRPTLWLVVPNQLPRRLSRQLAKLPVRRSVCLAGSLKSTVLPTERCPPHIAQKPWSQQLRICLISSPRKSSGGAASGVEAARAACGAS